MKSTTDIYGLILSGGFSSRMGKEKALINYHGNPQYQYLFQLLKPICHSVFLSCRKKQVEQFGKDIPYIFDLYDGIGPMNGLLSFFEKYPDSVCFLIACDMPYIDHETVLFLIKNRNPGKIATVFENKRGVPEPLLSIWEPESSTILKSQFKKGNYSLRDILRQSDIHSLTAKNPKVLLNVNDPEALEIARKELKLPPEKL